jgi:hypothetical protein
MNGKISVAGSVNETEFEVAVAPRASAPTTRPMNRLTSFLRESMNDSVLVGGMVMSRSEYLACNWDK